MAKERLDRTGPHRATFERNKKIILKTQNVCGICGKPVDLSLKAPNPLAPCIDHIIPVSKGGHPSDIDNLQLAHWTCNRAKSDKLYKESKNIEIPTNRNLPLSFNWKKYKKNRTLKFQRLWGHTPLSDNYSGVPPSLYKYTHERGYY